MSENEQVINEKCMVGMTKRFFNSFWDHVIIPVAIGISIVSVVTTVWYLKLNFLQKMWISFKYFIF